MLEGMTVSPECQDPGEHSPLSEAANQGHAGIVKLLLEYDADPNSKGPATPFGAQAYLCPRLNP